VPARSRPPAEVDISTALVGRLLRAQHPDLADLPLTEIATGWDCVVYRLGSELAVRLPRREQAATMVRSEQTWLPRIGQGLPIPTPIPVRVGGPGEGFPWTWSVVPFLVGEVAFPVDRVDPMRAAEDLGAFLGTLHQPAPADAPHNPYRGIPLPERQASVTENQELAGETVDQRAVAQVWEEALAARAWSGPALWIHGDLHPANILVNDGRISGVIDFVDITAGDPAADLMVGWMLFDDAGRARLREAYEAAASYDVTEDEWSRARGWALNHALACLAHSADDPLIGAIGGFTVGQIQGQVTP
jgi:aminoglycoside phosphotransferase (APT) family kinase protein